MLDVGCHPGGWTQVAVEEVGENGFVLGVDILSTSPIEGASIIIGDISENSTLEEISNLLGDRNINTVISDISPKLTGRYDTDQAISLELSTLVMDKAMLVLTPGGNFVTKIFQGTGIEGLMKAAKQRFSNVQRYAPHGMIGNHLQKHISFAKINYRESKEEQQGKTAYQQVQEHLEEIDVLVKNTETNETPTAKGFRKLKKKEN